MGTHSWREVVVEKTGVADNELNHARVATEYVNKLFRRHRQFTYRMRMNRMRIGLPNRYVPVKG